MADDAYLWEIFPDDAFPEEQWPMFGEGAPWDGFAQITITASQPGITITASQPVITITAEV